MAVQPKTAQPQGFLQFLAVVQAHPAIAPGLVRFEQSPALIGASAGALLHNGKDANARIFPGLCVVRARAFADVEVRDRNFHQVRLEGSLGSGTLPGIDCLAGFIEHRLARVLIRAGFRVGEYMEGTLLGLGIRPGLTDTVPDLCGLCRIRRIILRKVPTLNDTAKILDIR